MISNTKNFILQSYDRKGVLRKSRFNKQGVYEFANYAPPRPKSIFMFRAPGWLPFDKITRIYPNHLQLPWLLKKVNKGVTITGTFRDAKTRKIITNINKATFVVEINLWNRKKYLLKTVDLPSHIFQ